jgi:NADH-quinone oxidoreductase subunit H
MTSWIYDHLPTLTPMLWSMTMVVLVSLLLLVVVPGMLMIERWGSAWMQRRVGPNRVGPFGSMQPLADALKLVFKEENIPAQAHKVLFALAPALAVFPAWIAMSVIPLAGTFTWNGRPFNVQISNLNVGLLFVLAITSLHVYSVLMAGWSSNNKFSLMGALRSSSQMISYEIAIGISIVSMVILYGTLDLREIVKLQEHGSPLPAWGIVMQPICFIILWVCSFAETNRLPFDLPEGESELVAGYHTEYSGLKWALFFLGEYAAMFVASAFLTTLFLGGYNVPFISEAGLRAFFEGHGAGTDLASILTVLCQLLSWVLKSMWFMWVFVWVRWTLPRFRYDQLMDLGWKILLPLGVFNAIATMAVSYFVRR